MDNFKEKLLTILDRHQTIQKELNAITDFSQKRFIDLSKELAELSNIVPVINDFLLKDKEETELLDILSNSVDIELKQLAEQDLHNIKQQKGILENQIKLLLLPKDIHDDKGAILEIRAGTGGDEAGLFAASLLRMYEAYSSLHNWKFEILSINTGDIGSIKEVIVNIAGKGVFSRLKYESGVHRVQRVPETEASGRIHTSAATVAVLPEVEEVDIKIEEKDLQIDTYRASGAGGQHVNKTDSAVRITHIPTGTIVAVQDERSQHKNKEKAMKILRSKIYEKEMAQQETARAKDRKIQVGSGDRSERIRTYNFPQGRVSDHRINLTLYKIDKVMDGIALDEILDKLIEYEQIEKLKEC